MNSQTSTREKSHTKMKKAGYYAAILLIFVLYTQSLFAWEIDFSRRSKYLKQQTESQPLNQGSTVQESTAELLTLPAVAQSNEPAQDLVILNTEKGFLPQNVALKKGVRYRISVVNVNEKEKNVSFILNTFNQHHGTYYGVIKTFDLVPNLEGVYTFQCPETALEGRLVVLPNTTTDERGLASQN